MFLLLLRGGLIILCELKDVGVLLQRQLTDAYIQNDRAPSVYIVRMCLIYGRKIIKQHLIADFTCLFVFLHWIT